MTDMGMALATGCDCPQYPAEVERDCCCIGGTECVDGVRRSGAIDAPPMTGWGPCIGGEHAAGCTHDSEVADHPQYDHPLTNDCIGGGCEGCEQ